jgi:hypothetical protein
VAVGFEQRGEALAHDDVIFGQQNGDEGGHVGAVRAVKTGNSLVCAMRCSLKAQTR